jgi:heptaprenyl diphosphate synthase
LTETASETSTGLLEATRRIVAERLARIASATGVGEVGGLLPGKMLRTRLAGRVAGEASEALAAACAATELVHTASLCHDDVIDNAIIRRARPTLWQATSPSGAVLLGDLLLCEALDVLIDGPGAPHLKHFVAKVREVIGAETEQELLLRGRAVDEPTCLRLARTKTGPLFAFTAWVAGSADALLAAALDEAGYRVGTAYQLADDLFDVVAAEQEAGKTLGTDQARGKFTLPQAPDGGVDATREHIRELCSSAVASLGDWPDRQTGLVRFITDDLLPVFRQHNENLDLIGELDL